MSKEYVQNGIIIWLHEDQIDLETIRGMLSRRAVAQTRY